ncbi:phosphorylase b kinase regulatory subunit beta [Rhincodon typus]|uniref:phosphorylase b kinase regulatory subunit beta n=1 Tax=Rhincodon typus TaxID=259920 RepID=UPI00202FC4EB|nr:phosphorylase b kinase regulatory subunit beta [Rhincodon typus]
MPPRIDDDKGRTHELEYCAVKCMRGILYCYMRQADKVEHFKQHSDPSNCLHSVFNVHTGDEVLSSEEYGHLQIDAVSLFLLYLVEMISSGLQIIYNTDEVTFIQNLVFCVERSYRRPDFGMWERGSKYNNGSTELHSSSVGMAKAALEAINGFNLFGNQGCSWSVIFVDFDAHNRNRQTLCSLLPRESRSHNTDAALLPCISYPAFAVDDDALFDQTIEKVVRKLKGRYGLKRFLRDGYRTGLEDHSRRYYKPAEIKLFDGIECEFPLFYIYLIIDGVFREKPEQVKEYMALLEPLLLQSYDGFAIVPKYYYVPADFIEAERRAPGSLKRFPSNSGHDGNLFLWGQALYIIAKLLVDELISPKDLDPARRYVPPKEQRNISMRYSNQGLAENDVVVHVALIAESQRLQVFLNTYGIQTQTPQQVEPIQIWPQQELAKKGEHAPSNINGTEVERVEGVNFLGVMTTDNLTWTSHVDVTVRKTQQHLFFLRQLRIFGTSMMTSTNFNRYTKPEDDISLVSEAILLSILLKREGPNFITAEGTVMDRLERVYQRSGRKKHWSNVRFTASILGKQVDSLAPSITRVLVQGKQVTIGVFGHEEAVISNPLSPTDIKKIVYSKCSRHDEREAVLQQELVIHIGWLISNSPKLFQGMLKFRIGWIIHAMKHELKIQSENLSDDYVYQMSPSDVKKLLLDTLQPDQHDRSWKNRRHLDGSLNRTPKGFYDRVWQILERTPEGIIVTGKHLPQQPTLSDMTMYEMNFSLLVEDTLQDIVQPEYRQIIVELLMVVSVVLERNPELEFQGEVNLDKLVKEAFDEFKRDKSRLEQVEVKDMTDFYNTPPTGKRGTASYLMKAVMNALLEGEVKSGPDDPCVIC